MQAITTQETEPGIGRQMAKGAAWMVLFKLAERSLSLVSVVVLARLLVPADFGLVAMAMSIIQHYAPHVAEELWQRLGRERLWEERWPRADPALLERDTFELVVQVNGRVRDKVEVPVGLSDAELVARAKELPRVRAHLDGKEIRKEIVVPGKLVNLVVDA